MAGLEDLYREIVLDHYRNPRNRGQLEPPAHRTEGFNPLCGDEIVVFLQVNDDEIVTDLKIDGHGCSISQSSASMMSAAAVGKSVNDVRALTKAFKSMMSIHESSMAEADADESSTTVELKLGDLEALRGVVKFPVRIKCATLGWNTLNQAFEELGL